MDDWKIDRRKRSCDPCRREFTSEEVHYSGIVEVETKFERRDLCLPCFDLKPFELFSFWKTQMPRREERRFEDIGAMTEFCKRLLASPSEDPMRRKILYLTSLVLMRKKRLKLVGVREGRLIVEKSWDGDTAEIPDPAIGEAELEPLKLEMEKLFEFEFATPETQSPQKTQTEREGVCANAPPLPSNSVSSVFP